MKRQPRKAKRQRKPTRVWTVDQAQAAVPYLASVVRSWREAHLEAAGQRRACALWQARPGRPDRVALLHLEDLRLAAAAAEQRSREAHEELQALDTFPLDPVQGLVLLPFVHQEQLAWYVFDLFAQEPLAGWRYHDDPADACRPLGDLCVSA